MIAEARASARVRSLLADAFEHDQPVLVPAGVVAQTIRGGPKDALVNRLLRTRGVEVSIHDETRARIAGALLARARTNDAIDALVVAEAMHRGAGIILTSDPKDLADLAGDHPAIDIQTV